MGKLKQFYAQQRQNPVDFFAALLALSLPLSTALPNILLIPLAIGVALKFKPVRWKKFTYILVLFFGTLIIVGLSFFNHSFTADAEFVSRYALLFFTFFLFTQISNTTLVEQFFLLGLCVAMVGSSIAIGIHIYHNPGFLLASGSIVNKVLWLERPYFGFMLAVGIFIFLKNAEKKPGRYDNYFLAILFIAFTIYISARLAIGLSCLLIVVFLVRSYLIGRKTKIWMGVVLALLISIAFGLSDNLLARMRISNNLDKTIQKIKVYEPRFVIWPCAFDLAKNDMDLFTGYASHEKVEQKLTKCYGEVIERKGKRQYYLNKKFNTHNQFLSFLMLGGIFPMFLLGLMFIVAWRSKQVSFETKLILVLFFAFFLVENVFYRQMGCYLFGIFAALYSRKELCKN